MFYNWYVLNHSSFNISENRIRIIEHVYSSQFLTFTLCDVLVKHLPLVRAKYFTEILYKVNVKICEEYTCSISRILYLLTKILRKELLCIL